MLSCKQLLEAFLSALHRCYDSQELPTDNSAHQLLKDLCFFWVKSHFFLKI